MDVDSVISGGGLVVSGAALLKLGEIAAKAWQSRNQKADVNITPQPVKVEAADKFVTRQEFDRHVAQDESAHGDCFRRIEKVEQKASATDGKLDQIVADVTTIKNILIGKALQK